MTQSKYQAFYRELKSKLPNFLQPLGSRLLIEILPEIEIKSAGGIIYGEARNQRTDTKENKFTAAVVLDVGTGYVDDDGETVPLAYKPGQVIAIVLSGARIYSTHPMLGGQFTKGELADINESNISYLIAESLEEYDRALAVIEDMRLAASK